MPEAPWMENLHHAKRPRCKPKGARRSQTAPLRWAVGSCLRRDQSQGSLALQGFPARAWARSISLEWSCAEEEKGFRYKSARTYRPWIRQPTQSAERTPVRLSPKDRRSYRPGETRKDRWGHHSRWLRTAPQRRPLFWRALRGEHDRRNWAAAPAPSSTQARRQKGS